MTIHKEGYASIAIATIFAALLYSAARFGLPEATWLHTVALSIGVLVFLIVLQFFRSPTKHIVQNPTHILAPADGKVVVIEEVVEPEYLKDKRIQVSIFMSPINVHSNLNPVAGVVSYFKYHAGKYLVAWHPKASTENERTTVAVRMNNGVEVLFRQIAGALAKRIVWYVKEGQAVEQGSEFGFIKFGSRVDIYLPLGTEIVAKLGDKTTGGETVIAKLK